MRERFSSTLPVWHVDDEGRCGCGWSKCRRPGKHADERAPATSGAYAVITGAKETSGSGVVVIDLDCKGGDSADGVEQFHKLARDNEIDTLVVSTPSGGYHLYFQHPGHGIHIGNGKLASAIDVRGDKANEDGCAYVVGPASPGYTVDPEDDVPIAPLPEWLLGLLLTRTTAKKKGFAPTPVELETEEGQRRVEMGVKACLEMPPSQADGEGGRALFAVCLRLVRGLELPLDKALELVVEHFNPRCTTPTGKLYPWAEEDIAHKLEDARDKSDLPCGLASLALADVVKKHATPPALRPAVSLPTNKRKVHDQAHTYKYEPGEAMASRDIAPAEFADLVFAFTRGADWDGCWQFNEFTKRVVCINPPIRLDAETKGITDTDLANIRTVLEYSGLKAGKEDIYSAILAAASATSFHPIREYLASLPACGNPSAVLDRLASRLFGSSDPMADVFLRKTLIGAVRRVLQPGCKVDTMLVLAGAQGLKKSTAIATLFGRENFKDDLADLSSKDAAIGLNGVWVVEIAELATTRKAEQNQVKAFLSRCVDKYRPPYGKCEVETPRQCIMVGSTNDQEILQDVTGGRRFWPIKVQIKIDTEWLAANRDAIWAAAYSLAMSGEPHWLTDAEEGRAEEVRAPYTEIDPWHELIEEACRGKEWVRVDSLYSDVLNKGGTDGLMKLDRRTQLRIAGTLKRLGCEQEMVTEGDRRFRAWLIPPPLRAAEPRKGPAKVIPLRTTNK